MTDRETMEELEPAGLTAGGLFAKCRQYLDNLRVEMDADDPREAEVIGATRTLTDILERFTILRSRLEEVEEERDRWRAEFDKASDNLAAVCEELAAARRRADRLEGAVRTVLNEHRMAEDWSLPERLEEYLTSALSALDSREDEGEAKNTTGPVDEHPRMRHPYGHDMTYETTKKGYGRCSCGARENTDAAVERCPHNPMSELMSVHADEPEGDEHLTEYVCDSCGGRFWFETEELDPVEGRTDCLLKACEGLLHWRGSEPTDEPVSGEGDGGECSCPPWPTSHPDPACPTHADARSEGENRDEYRPERALSDEELARALIHGIEAKAMAVHSPGVKSMAEMRKLAVCKADRLLEEAARRLSDAPSGEGERDG